MLPKGRAVTADCPPATGASIRSMSVATRSGFDLLSESVVGQTGSTPQPGTADREMQQVSHWRSVRANRIVEEEWVGGVAEEQSRSECARLFDLVTRPSDWIHRRIDRTDIEADGETTRRLSFDLTITRDAAIQRAGGVVVPLTLITKAPLRRLDTFGPDGRALPVLGRQDNGNLVVTMLVDALSKTVDGELPSTVTEAIRAAVFEDETTQMKARVTALNAAMAPLDTPDPQQVDAVLSLAADLTRHFLFAVLLPEECIDKRVIVKVSVAEHITGEFPDWAFSKEGRSMDLPLAMLDSAESAHFEFRAPLGLRVASVALLDEMGEEFDPPGPSIRAGRTAHLTGLQGLTSESGTPISARVELEPVADGLVGQTARATAFVAILMFVGAMGVGHVQDALAANRGGSVAAAALAVPALFLSLQARRPEHAWVARALFVPRLLNYVTAVLLYSAAIYLVMTRPETDSLAMVMWLFFVVQLVPTLIAIALFRVVSADPSTL